MSPSKHQEHWQDGFKNELSYWRYILADMGAAEGVSEDTRARLDPLTPLQDIFRELADGRKTVRILDVGAGVLTNIGKVWDEHTVDITAVDPLANYYDDMLTEFGIEPPVRTIEGQAENLPKQFPRKRFDIVAATNALDHSADAPASIQGMWKVVDKGGWLFLSHAINEAETHRYQGMHCWNFFVDEDYNLMVRDNEQSVSVLDLIDDVAEKRVTVSDAPNKPGWIVACYQKKA
jgi:SAM-dependent methyltransferase